MSQSEWRSGRMFRSKRAFSTRTVAKCASVKRERVCARLRANESCRKIPNLLARLPGAPRLPACRIEGRRKPYGGRRGARISAPYPKGQLRKFAFRPMIAIWAASLGGVFVQHRKSTRSLLIENEPGYAKIIERRLIFLQDLQEALAD